MDKNKIIKMCIILVLLITVFIFFSYKYFKLPNTADLTNGPKIELRGKKNINIKLGDKYKEPGYVAYDSDDGDITNKVIVENNINSSVPGNYQMSYVVTNSMGTETRVTRNVNVMLNNKVEYKDEYDKVNNKTKGWGTNNKRDGNRPLIDISEEELKKYNAYAMGKDEKVIYLTFDEGTQESYLEEIVDVLDRNEVKATFFLCKRYISNNAELMKKMVSSGHSIGNHTVNHLSMPSLATRKSFKKYLNEIIETEKAFEDAVGMPMEKIYREPRGEYSMRTLTILKDLGYKTYFWSAAYQDWDDHLSKDQALEGMLDRLHNGVIYLLHTTSRGNYLAMEEFIQKVKSEGYRFDLVKNISD